MSCGPFLLNICGRLSQELSIVEVSGLNHFLAPAILQLTCISYWTLSAHRRVENRIYMFVFRPVLVNLCGRLSRELSIVEVSGLNHFLAPAILQLTYISVLSFCARKRVEIRVYMFVFYHFSQTLRDAIFRTKHCRGIRFEQFCRYCCPPVVFYFLFHSFGFKMTSTATLKDDWLLRYWRW